MDLIPSAADAPSQPAGRSYPVSHYRRLVADLMHFSAKVPSATVERPMRLAKLVEARQGSAPAPTWSAIFTKAYALVAARTPVLRTSYLTFPAPRFYEHPVNIATLNVDRQLVGERIVLYAKVAHPEALALGDIDALIQRHRQGPLDALTGYRNAARLSRVPWPLRRALWWAGLNVLGGLRCHHFGTFGVTSVGALGAGLLHIVPLLTSTLHYGMFDASGVVAMRLSFDHRVLDGATAATALADMEAALGDEILAECSASARPE
jgi:hypothetical protein